MSEARDFIPISWVPAYGIARDGTVKRLGPQRRACNQQRLPPDDPRKTCVAHLDGNRSHNHVSNLQWVTYAENDSHKIAHGTRLRGEQLPASKLTREQVLDIRRLHATGRYRYNQLARRFSVSPPLVRGIVLRRWWRWLGDQEACHD